MNKPFKKIKEECSELYEWIKEISRFSKVEDFILPDYKNEIKIYFYTKENKYCIFVIPKDKTYLGCTVLSRKARAGEDWQRGRDLADGKYCKDTWNRIKNSILSHELVKIAKKNR